MTNRFLYYLLLLASILLIVISGQAQFDPDDQATPQDYSGPWGEGIKCPYENPPFPDGTTVYKGSVLPAMTTAAVNYLHDAKFLMFQVSDTRTYPDLANLYFVMRKEFHTWHYSDGKLLTGCWTGVTVYQYTSHP